MQHYEACTEVLRAITRRVQCKVLCHIAQCMLPMPQVGSGHISGPTQRLRPKVPSRSSSHAGDAAGTRRRLGGAKRALGTMATEREPLGRKTGGILFHAPPVRKKKEMISKEKKERKEERRSSKGKKMRAHCGSPLSGGRPGSGGMSIPSPWHGQLPAIPILQRPPGPV
jgi:hypothetical protein